MDEVRWHTAAMVRVPQSGPGWVAVRSALLAVAIEAVTLLCRFGLDLRATRDTASTVGRLTFGLRVHHSYVGIAVLILAYLLRKRVGTRQRWVLALGWALVISDLVHHFAVLWPLTGSPQFDLVYPPG